MSNTHYNKIIDIVSKNRYWGRLYEKVVYNFYNDESSRPEIENDLSAVSEYILFVLLEAVVLRRVYQA